MLRTFAFFSASLWAAGALAQMPMPQSISLQPGSVAIDSTFSVELSGASLSDARVKAAVQRLFRRLIRQTGIPIAGQVFTVHQPATMTVLVESADHSGPQRVTDNERYSLDISGGHIRLSADAPLGALRGIETMLQLVRQNQKGDPGFSISGVHIQDEPRFPWRGLSLDVSRHFMPFEQIKRTIDGLAAVKLNVLHWHLSDDQGFRIESKKFPRLQQLSSDGLYYNQAQVREVIAYARDRGVRVVPEFDVPGHATSWFVAYPKLASGPGPYQIVRNPGILTALMDPSNEATYRFLDTFIGEMAKLFPDEYFHIGGDEVNPSEWKKNVRIQAFMRKHGIADSKALHAYFNQRLLKIVTKHGKRMEGWDEILHPDLPKSILIQSWRGQESLAAAARQGYPGILSAGYYLDLMQPAAMHYAIDPLKMPAFKAPNDPAKQAAARERYDHAAAELASLTLGQKKLILGGEAAMWEELATSENLDAKLWPRLAAIAERLWSPEAQTDVRSMYERLEATSRWLEFLDLTHVSALALMRRRLAGDMPVEPLNRLAELLEPLKGYKRHSSEKYNTLTPFNRLVDSIPPESEPAREFNATVDDYLATPSDTVRAEQLTQQLSRWSDDAAAVRPTLQTNTLLNEDLVLADLIARVAQIGKSALRAIASHKSLGEDWHKQSQQTIEEALQPHASMLIPIAPAIQRLATAVP